MLRLVGKKPANVIPFISIVFAFSINLKAFLINQPPFISIAFAFSINLKAFLMNVLPFIYFLQTNSLAAPRTELYNPFHPKNQRILLSAQKTQQQKYGNLLNHLVNSQITSSKSRYTVARSPHYGKKTVLPNPIIDSTYSTGSTMTRRKRNSQTIEKAQRRLESLQSIDPNLDFGNDVSLPIYREQIEQARQAIASYNTLLSMVDEAKIVVEATEQQLMNSTTRLLKNVGARYGEDSIEYLKAGGKPRGSKRQVANSFSSRLASPMGRAFAPPSIPMMNISMMSQNLTAATQSNGHSNPNGSPNGTTTKD
jgi:hypothetical protein